MEPGKCQTRVPQGADQSNSAQPEHPPGEFLSVWTTWAAPTSLELGYLGQGQLKPKYTGQGRSGRPLNTETPLQRRKDEMGGLFLKKEGRSIPNVPLAGDRQSHHLKTQRAQLQKNTVLAACSAHRRGPFSRAANNVQLVWSCVNSCVNSSKSNLQFPLPFEVPVPDP